MAAPLLYLPGSAAGATQLKTTLEYYWKAGVESVELAEPAEPGFSYAHNGLDWGGFCVNGTRQSNRMPLHPPPPMSPWHATLGWG